MPPLPHLHNRGMSTTVKACVVKYSNVKTTVIGLQQAVHAFFCEGNHKMSLSRSLQTKAAEMADNTTIMVQWPHRWSGNETS